mgnify:CR=1 FL=1
MARGVWTISGTMLLLLKDALQKNREDIRPDRRDIREDRRDLRTDSRDLRQDHRDLQMDRQDLRSNLLEPRHQPDQVRLGDLLPVDPDPLGEPNQMG